MYIQYVQYVHMYVHMYTCNSNVVFTAVFTLRKLLATGNFLKGRYKSS